MACALGHESVWLEKHRYEEAEKNYFVHLTKLLNGYVNKNNTKTSEDKVNKQPIKEMVKEKKETTQNATASPNTKKEKEKKNKRINKSTVMGGNNIVEQSVTEGANTKKPEDNPSEVKDVTQKPKNKKDKHRKTRENNRKDNDENREKNPVSACNGSKGKEDFQLQDEKKVNSGSNPCTLVSEIAKARQHIKNSLERMDGIAALAAASPGGDVLQRLTSLENENKNLVQLTKALQKTLSDTQNRMKTLETRIQELSISSPTKTPATAKPSANDDDDGVDLFGSDSEEEDEAASKIREQRLAEYAAKKSKKPALIAKSSLVLDIKPWDDETDLKEMETHVRKITSDGLLWGASKLVPVAFGIKKLSISCVVEDEKVSIDWLTEEIEKIEDFVQSVDVAAFNKI